MKILKRREYKITILTPLSHWFKLEVWKTNELCLTESEKSQSIIYIHG